MRKCVSVWGWSSCLFNVRCQAVVEGYHLLPLIGSSHHKGLVLCCSCIQVQFWPESHGHTKAQRSHTHTAVDGTRKEPPID